VGTRTWIAVAVVAVLVAGGVVLAGLALGGEDSQSSAAEYQVAAVQARDRVDFALGRLSQAQSIDELLERMDEAAAAIDSAAGKLDETTPPDALSDGHDRLVNHMETLSSDVQATADQARVPGFEEILFSGKGLNFESWDKINAVFVTMKEHGVVVPPLSRHTTS
jgi:UDP-N-acetylmuramoylalanine-D-glutamate ligase